MISGIFSHFSAAQRESLSHIQRAKNLSRWMTSFRDWVYVAHWVTLMSPTCIDK